MSLFYCVPWPDPGGRHRFCPLEGGQERHRPHHQRRRGSGSVLAYQNLFTLMSSVGSPDVLDITIYRWGNPERGFILCPGLVGRKARGYRDHRDRLAADAGCLQAGLPWRASAMRNPHISAAPTPRVCRSTPPGSSARSGLTARMAAITWSYMIGKEPWSAGPDSGGPRRGRVKLPGGLRKN